MFLPSISKPLNYRLSFCSTPFSRILCNKNHRLTFEYTPLIGKPGTTKHFWKPTGKRSLCTRRRKRPLTRRDYKNCRRSRSWMRSLQNYWPKRKQSTRTTARHWTRCRSWFGHRKTWNDFLQKKSQHRRTSRLDKSRLPGTDREWSVSGIFCFFAIYRQQCYLTIVYQVRRSRYSIECNQPYWNGACYERIIRAASAGATAESGLDDGTACWKSKSLLVS